jgi:hypothetical protein
MRVYAAEATSRSVTEQRAARDKAVAAEKALAAATVELKAVKDSSRVRELEEEVARARSGTETARRELDDVSAQRDELSALLDAHNTQLEAYMAEIKSLQEDRDTAVEEALRIERGEETSAAAGRKATVVAAQGAVKEERNRSAEIASQKADVDRQLEEARQRLAEYERGYGLSEAAKEADRLRDSIRRRDADIARLTRTAGGQLDALEIAIEVARRLAERAGMPRSVDVFKIFPELELRTGIETAGEKLRSINGELQRQNESLEEQRLKLLHQLRVHATNLGDTSLRYFGLSSEQLMIVNEFAESLRDGSAQLPVHDRTVEVQAELARVRVQLEDARREADEARSSGGAARTAVALLPAAAANSTVDLPPSLLKTLQQLADDNKALRTQTEALFAGRERANATAVAEEALAAARREITALRAANADHEESQLKQLMALREQLTSSLDALHREGLQEGRAGAPQDLEQRLSLEAAQDAHQRLETAFASEMAAREALKRSHAAEVADLSAALGTLRSELASVKASSVSVVEGARAAGEALRTQAAAARADLAVAQADLSTERALAPGEKKLVDQLAAVSAALSTAVASLPAGEGATADAAAVSALSASVAAATTLITETRTVVEGRVSASVAERDAARASAEASRAESSLQVVAARAEHAQAEAASVKAFDALKARSEDLTRELAAAKSAAAAATEDARAATLRLPGPGALSAPSRASQPASGSALASSVGSTLMSVQALLAALQSRAEAKGADASVTRALRDEIAAAQGLAAAHADRAAKAEAEARTSAAALALSKAGLHASLQQVLPASLNDSGAAEVARTFGPRTAGGRAALKLLRRNDPEGTPEEMEDWAGEVIDARAALVEALEELVVREDETTRFEGLVREYAGKAGEMVSQQTALYRAYIAEKAGWESSLAAAREAQAEAEARANALGVKANRLEEATAVMEAGQPGAASTAVDMDAADALAYVSAATAAAASGLTGPEAEARRTEAMRRLRGYVKGLARKLAALEVAQPMLARRYNLAKAEAASARAGQRSSELAAVEMETHLRSRVLYLELWKKGGESRLTRLDEVASSWVPGDEHASTVAALTSLQAQHAELLAMEGTLRVQYTELRALPAKMAELQASSRMAGAELETAQAAVRAAKEEAASARSSMTAAVAAATGSVIDAGPLADPAAGMLSTASRSDLIVALSKQRALLGETEVSLAGLTKKASLLATRVAELEGATEALQKRAHEAEETAADARAAASKARASVPPAATAVESAVSAPAASPRALAAALAAMTEERDTLSRELHKARGVADIASDQARAVEGLIKDRELEMEELREGLRRLSARSDDDAIIGALQHQLLTLKTSYHTFLRKHEAQRSALLRLRVAATALEVGVDQRGGEVLALREDSRVRSIALHRLLDDVRAQLRAMEGAGTTLANATSFNDSVRRLSGTVVRQAAEVEAAVRAQAVAEEAVAARATEVASLARTVEDLRLAAAAAGGRAGVGGRTTGSEARDVARRLVELNDALKGAQLAGLRQRRELGIVRDEARLAKRRGEEYETHIRALEERLVAVDTDMRRREDEHHRAMRTAVAQANVEAGESAAIVASTPGPAPSAGAPASRPRAGHTDEDTARVQQLETALADERRAGRELRDKARAAVERSRLRGRRVMFLESQLSATGFDVAGLKDGYAEEDGALRDIIGGGASDEEAAGSNENAAPGSTPARKTAVVVKAAGTPPDAGLSVVKQAYEDELGRMQKAAVATTRSLKELLSQKNGVITEYQRKLEKVRAEREAEKSKEAREREAAVAAAFTEGSTTIEKLKASIAALTASSSQGAGNSGVVSALSERADALEKALAERDRRIAEMSVELRDAVGRAAASTVSSTALAAPASTSASVLAGDLDAARRRADEAERKLRDEVTARDRKLRALQASFGALKEEFVRAEEEHAAALVHAQATVTSATARAGRAAVGVGSLPQPPSASRSAALARTPGDDGKDEDGGEEALEGLRDAALRDKVGGLVEQVARMGRDVRTLRAALTTSEEEKGRLGVELEKVRSAHAALRSSLAAAAASTATPKTPATGAGPADAAVAKLRADNVRLGRELEAARAAAVPGATMATAGAGGSEAELVRKVKMLEAHVAALRSAQAEASLSSTGSPSASMLVASAAKGTAPATMPPPAPGAAPNSSAALAAGAALAETRAAWESERKLRKRVEALQTKLGEATKAAECGKAAEEALNSALTKVKTERDVLDKKAVALTKRLAAVDAATAAALAQVEPVAELKARLFELSEALALAKAAADGEAAVRIKRAEARAQEALLQAEGAAQDAAEARARLVASVGSAEVGLRDKLAEARRSIAALDGAVLAKDAALLEARMEGEAARQAEDRLRRRLAEVQAFAALAGGGGKGSKTAAAAVGAPPAVAAPATSAASAKREQELTDLTVALKRVTDKQRTEIDRLQKQLLTVGNARDAVLSAAASAASASAQASVVRELASASMGVAPAAAAPAPSAATANAAAAAADLKALKARYAALERSHTALATEAGVLREKDAAMARKLAEAEAVAAAATAAVASGAAAAPSAPVVTFALPPSPPATAVMAVPAAAPLSADASSTELRTAYDAKERECADLRAELSAFDLDFFEELETLKHNYAEAALKCQAFDGEYGSEAHRRQAHSAHPLPSYPAEYVRLYPPSKNRR